MVSCDVRLHLALAHSNRRMLSFGTFLSLDKKVPKKLARGVHSGVLISVRSLS